MAIRVSQIAVEVLSTVVSNPAAVVSQVGVEVATLGIIVPPPTYAIVDQAAVEFASVRPVTTYAIVDQAAVEIALIMGQEPPPPPPPTTIGPDPLLAQGTSVQMSIDECTDVMAPFPPMVLMDCTTKSVTVTGGVSAEIRTSTMCSVASEFRIGKTDNGTLTVEGFWKIGDSAHDAVAVASRDRKRRLLLVTFRDGSKWRCVAMVSQRTWNAAVDGVVGSTCTFKLTGPAVEVLPPVVI
jgi:hypothetical protein